MSKKVECLVVDTTAFIKNAALHELSSQITTIQEVVNEVTNKRQIRRLVVLPYDLEIKNVFQENIQFITEFSKKTGDYPSLSATDIKVMALVYQLEKEKVGTDHLKKEPHMNRVITFTDHLPEESKATVGFYFPTKKTSDENDKSCETEINAISEKLEFFDCNESGEDSNENRVGDILLPVQDTVDEQNCRNELDYNSATGSESTDEYLSAEDNSDDERDEGNDEDEDDDYDEEDDDDDDDDNGWITPQNIANKKQEISLEAEKPLKVACITSDFAMQNVLKHIGLNVMSTDGRQIHELRTFILRCYACFKTTSIITKIFCPNCGNKTLKKVAVSVKEDGTQVIHISSRKRLTARGKRYSLPTPKGGKHANNPILCEDQRVPNQRPSRLARTKNNPLDPDYTAGFSPFVMRDVNSRSAMLGIRGSDLKAAIRRNPNDNRRKGKKK